MQYWFLPCSDNISFWFHEAGLCCSHLLVAECQLMVLARNMQVRARADAGLQLTWGSAIELKLIVFISFRNFAPWSLLIHSFKMNHKKLETQKYFFFKKTSCYQTHTCGHCYSLWCKYRRESSHEAKHSLDQIHHDIHTRIRKEV